MTDPRAIADGLSAEERALLAKLNAGHLWPLGAQPGCSVNLYRRGLTTSDGEYVPMRPSSMGRAVAKILEERANPATTPPTTPAK